MQQLKMQAFTADRAEERKLPLGYFFEGFNDSEKDVADWKAIMSESPFLALEDPDACYQAMIVKFPDCNPKQDIWFVCNEKGERVASITMITHSDGSGYVHMVKAKLSEQGKGIGHAMVRYALRVFAERGVDRVVLTTDDFRVAAIKTYLDAGFVPVIYKDPESDMQQRWDAVLKKLNYDVQRIVAQD